MLFEIQLLTSFVAGGLLIALQTLIAERVSLKWRGIVLTVPTTMALGIFFVGLTKTAGDIPDLVRVIPAAISAVYVFVVIFALLARYGIIPAFVGAYAGWGVLAYLLIQYPPASFGISILYAVPVVTLMYLIVRKLPQVSELKVYPMNFNHILIRSLIGGVIIVAVVFLAKTLGNVWGGMFSAFPASYTATFLIYHVLQGGRAISSVAKSLFLPGIPGFILYAYISALTFPEYGIWIGTLAAYAVTMLYFMLWMKVRERFI
ncbi:MAG: hypothetical protein ABH856_00315 [Patescibacteria group bacterium]|nr:hypothetical protein [Patescibacteria group bacterium]